MAATGTSSAYPVDISREIEGSLLAFSSITGLPVTFYDTGCQVRMEYGSQYKICKFLPVYNQEGGSCRQHLLSALRTAGDLGEPYFFVCAAGFVNIAVPLIQKGETYGCFIAGPIIMEKFSQRTIARVLSLNMTGDMAETTKGLTDPSDFLSRVIAILRDMYIYSSREVAHLAVLMSNSVKANLTDKSDYDKAKARYQEQAQIGDSLQKLKQSGKETGYPLAAEHRLVRQVQAGKKDDALLSMAAYLNGVLLYEAGNLDLVKIHLIELCALVSREGGSGDSPGEQTIRDSFSYIETLEATESIQELKTWSEDLVTFFAKRASETPTGTAALVGKARQMIQHSENCRLTLWEAAEALHVNPSYLSAVFKKETGIGFNDFLTRHKVDQAKTLLTTTNLRLLEIADLCGFEDQSYFSKVFSRHAGQSPRKYRESFNMPPNRSGR